jgi:hypothetical protein
MASEQENINRLSSWKEIAAYLDCDVRTCRRWEMSKGLPIHRVGQTEKARVYAYRYELEQWLREQAQKNNHKQRNKRLKFTSRWYFLTAAFLLFVAVAVSYFTISALSYDRNPFDFRIERSQLVIFNQAGQEIWRFDTGLENLAIDSSYRERWQYKRRIEHGMVDYPTLIIKDIDGDRKAEVLFSIQTQDERNEGELVCFSSTGKEMWRFQSGRRLTFGDKVYSTDYRIKGFELHDVDKDGSLEILLIAVHNPDFPCQLTILDHRGQKKGEYWNAGYITDIEFHDLDQDGKEEMLVSGINNGYGKGCLYVFDPSQVSGYSPQSLPHYRCKDLKSGSFSCYILFPRTDIRPEYPVDGIMAIDIMENGGLSLVNNLGKLIYELNRDLSIHRVVLTHTFQEMHNEARHAGKIDTELDDAYIKRLREGLLYFDGQGWVSDVTGCRETRDYAIPFT